MAPRKVLILLVDGIGDTAIPELGYQTPLLYADTPCLDMCAAMGVNGLMDSVEPGLACGSDTAHLNLFGYDPRQLVTDLKRKRLAAISFRFYRGRGAFETMGAGLEMEPGDIAFKSNFAVWDPETNIVLSRRADRNFEQDGPILCAALDGSVLKDFPDHQISVKYATEHRCAVRIRGPDLSDSISGTDPLKDHLPLKSCHPIEAPEHLKQGNANQTSRLINALSLHFHDILKNHPVNVQRRQTKKPEANCVLLRGCGMRLDVPSLYQKYPWFFSDQSKAFAIAPTCIIAGLAETIGIDVHRVLGATGDYHTDLTAKADAAVFHLSDKNYRLGFVHVKAVDDAGHDRRVDLKCGFLEKIDRMLQRIIETWSAEEDVVIVITGDHSTPVLFGDHSFEPVPFSMTLLSQVKKGLKADKKTDVSNEGADRVQHFSEIHAAAGILGRFPGSEAMPTLLRYALEHNDIAQRTIV